MGCGNTPLICGNGLLNVPGLNSVAGSLVVAVLIGALLAEGNSLSRDKYYIPKPARITVVGIILNARPAFGANKW